ncbi:MAG: DUF1345 domain-containing protein, partial [Pseudomonadota bacterium]|nr:DUF1345 domain-containing protein [Pseudomonadota bacterium]
PSSPPAKKPPPRVLAHHRLVVCAIVGGIAAVAWPDVQTLLSRALIGWNVLAWLYLGWVVVVLSRADSGHIKRVALAQADSAANVLTVVVVAAVTSLVAVVFELIAAKAAGPHHAAAHLAFAFVTVLGSWLLLPTVFALTYAAAYYGPDPDCGLEFPGAAAKFEPDHTDFLYFSYTIAVTAQTSDVAVTTREMRRLVIFQSVMSFVFNTTILAFAINAAASFF